jgi:hypothetical protein
VMPTDIVMAILDDQWLEGVPLLDPAVDMPTGWEDQWTRVEILRLR